jgi:hypothetical protein
VVSENDGYQRFDPDRLLADRLVELESAWRGMGAPIADALAPGLSRELMTVMARNEGLVLPEALYTWWGWHNGVDPDYPHPHRATTGLLYDLISFQQALSLRAESCRTTGTLTRR